MIQGRNIPQTYWEEEVHTIVHILNKYHLRPNCDKTPYELWHGKPTSIKHFRVFGNKRFIKNNDENLGKCDEELMKEYFWDMHQIVRVTIATIRGCIKLWKELM